MAKRKKKIVKVTDGELERLQGLMAQRDLVTLRAQQALAEINGKIGEIAGAGREFEQREDGVYKVPRAEAPQE